MDTPGSSWSKPQSRTASRRVQSLRWDLQGIPPFGPRPSAKFSNSGRYSGLAKVVHEPATNGAKYGPLSIPGGQVSVSWDSKPNGQAATRILEWRDTGGPPWRSRFDPATAPALFASSSHTSAVAVVDLVFASDGAFCGIEFPLEHAWLRSHALLNRQA